MVGGLWSVVCGLWSVVSGWWSVVGGIQVFWLFRPRSDNLFRRHSGNILAFFCVPHSNVAKATHENAAETSCRGGRQKVFFLVPVALITSGKVVRGLLLVVCGWWLVVCGLWSLVYG